MFNGRNILALIPARGGSKGIKDKNIISLAGEPLISYTINSALNSKYIDKVVVSTDSNRIADVARQYGACVPFMRPPELATDNSKTVDAVIHALTQLRSMGYTFDILVLLQATQPLRDVSDIDGAIETYVQLGSRPLASVSSVNDHPLLMRTLGTDGILVPLLNQNSTCRRQDMPAFYRINGCIYINKVMEINEDTSFNDNIIPYIMNTDHSVDIDEMVDLAIAEYYLKCKQDQ